MINAYYLTQEFKVSGRSEHFEKLVVNAYTKASNEYFETLLEEVEQIDPKANEAILEVLIDQLANGEPSRWEEMALYGLTIIAMVVSLLLFDSLEVSTFIRYLSSTLIAFVTLFIGIRILKQHQLRRVQRTIDFLFDPEKEGCAE
jgi:hypothetical protein